jgi:Kae1-associated kinase Bud32
MEILGQGAEATITKRGNEVLKERTVKDYRLPVIDEQLRKARTRREAKIIEKLAKLNFPSPRLRSMSDTRMLIAMDYIEGPKVRDILNDNVMICEEIGQKIAILHKNDIIHGDLTTSNMIMGKEVNFIDFGLSFVSKKVEDKAVDLHLMRQALESKHYTIYKDAFDRVLTGYRSYVGADEVIKRLELVEQRGRNKHK